VESVDEFPRIPIRGKRLPGLARKSGDKESGTPAKGGRRGKPQGGEKKRR
jgi:hypothetical protein